MKKWKIIFSSCLFFSTVLVQAQEKKMSNDRIGFELGFGSFFGSVVMPDHIRASKIKYDDFYCGFPGPNQEAVISYGGIKFEHIFGDNRFGFSTGLRFSEISAAVSPNWNKKYFLWLFRQEGLITDYLRIQNITQKNYYLGVPLELRYIFPKRTDTFFKQYVKLGAAVNCLVSTKNSIAFYDNAMAQYASAVSDTFEKPDFLNAYIYPAYGFKFGKLKDLNFNIEISFPGFLIGNKAHPFIKQDSGIGVQLSLQLPVSKIIK